MVVENNMVVGVDNIGVDNIVGVVYIGVVYIVVVVVVFVVHCNLPKIPGNIFVAAPKRAGIAKPAAKAKPAAPPFCFFPR